MDLVVDANVLFSAAIKDSATAELILRDDLDLHAPDYLFEEFERYRQELLGKAHRTDREFERFVGVLRGRIRLHPREGFDARLPEARRISPDPGDVPYLALALALGAAIWSDDGKLGEQESVPLYTTTELIGRLVTSRDE